MVLVFYRDLMTELVHSDAIVLLVVIQSEGSSPGRQGFLMYVSKDNMSGSIGGGIMEHKLVEMSRAWLTKGPFKPTIKHQVHQAEAEKNKSGMICSGKQTIAVYYLDKKFKKTLEKIVRNPLSSILYSENGIDVVLGSEKNILAISDNVSQWSFIQNIASKSIVYIVGGGHVSLALSEVMSKLDFEIHLLDHRPNLNTFEQNNFVYTKNIIQPEDSHMHISEGDSVYVVIMTFGFRTDKIILKSLLGKNFKFVGMMGSRHKSAVLLNELRNEGFPEADLQRVVTPVGIDIKSETPYEIAISIAAQLIEIKNRD